MIDPSTSNEKRASTSVDTLPGTILRISLPNSTSKRSRVESTFSSMLLPCSDDIRQPSTSGREGGGISEDTLVRSHGITDMVFPIGNSYVHQLSIFLFLACGEDQAGVRGSILRLVFADGSKITRVTDNRGSGSFELFKRGSHGDGRDELSNIDR